MDFNFDGLGEASGRVEVTAGEQVSIKVQVRGIRRSLHLGHEVGCELHWACLDDSGAWQPPLVQPAGSRAVDPVASRIECKFEAVLSFPKDKAPSAIVFVVLVHGNGEHWLKAPGQENFVVKVDELAQAAPPAAMAIAGGADGAPARVAERPAEWREMQVSAKAKLVTQIAGLEKTIDNLNTGSETTKKTVAEMQGQMKRASETREAKNSEFQQAVTDQRLIQMILQKATEVQDDLERVEAQASRGREQAARVEAQAMAMQASGAEAILDMFSVEGVDIIQESFWLWRTFYDSRSSTKPAIQKAPSPPPSSGPPSPSGPSSSSAQTHAAAAASASSTSPAS